MGKAQAASNVSIDEQLASIREAIHEEFEVPAAAMASDQGRPASFDLASALAAPLSTRKSFSRDTGRPLNPKPGSAAMAPKRGGGSARIPVPPAPTGQGFSTTLQGSVRLEEALARLSRAGRLPATGSRPAVDVEPEPRSRRVELRPAVADDPADAMAGDVDVTRPTVRGASQHATATGSRLGKPGLAPAVAEEAPMNGRRPRVPSVAPAMEALDEGHRPQTRDIGLQYTLEKALPELLSPSASASAASAFSRLAEALTGRSPGADRTMEETTRDLLRPLLKSWLDDHLPGIVERLVREEIERVARRGGR